MSVEGFMVHEAVHRQPSGETQSSSGEITTTYSETAVTMYLQPNSGSEIAADRNTPVGDWLGIGRVSDGFTSESVIVYDSHVLRVVAPPREEPNPRLDTISHVELDLEEVT